MDLSDERERDVQKNGRIKGTNSKGLQRDANKFKVGMALNLERLSSLRGADLTEKEGRSTGSRSGKSSNYGKKTISESDCLRLRDERRLRILNKTRCRGDH